MSKQTWIKAKYHAPMDSPVGTAQNQLTSHKLVSTCIKIIKYWVLLHVHTESGSQRYVDSDAEIRFTVNIKM